MKHNFEFFCKHCKTKNFLNDIDKDKTDNEIKVRCHKCNKINNIHVASAVEKKSWWQKQEEESSAMGTFLLVILIIGYIVLFTGGLILSPFGLVEKCQEKGYFSKPWCIIDKYIFTGDEKLQAFGEQVKDSIVWVSYEVSGKTTDGRYFESGGASGSGVIYAVDGSKMKVFTNRHVIDCSFGEAYCLERMSEKIKFRTQDGKIHSVSKILYAPHNMDIAILEVNLPSSEKYKPASKPSSFTNISENVIAIGYPDAGLEGNYVEFSVSKGKITGTRQIIVQDGFGFEVYDSDAYVNHGSSGGGLFDENGNLIGITTWGSTFGSYSVAIKLDVIDNFDTYITCNNGYPIEDKCFNYCKLGQSLGNDGKCYSICDDYYCKSDIPEINSQYCSKDNYILGADGWCHVACNDDSYCQEGSICYKNQCVSCPSGTYLYEDGNCREYQ